MTQPSDIEELTAALRADMTRVWDLILAERDALLAAWPDLPVAVRSHRLATFQVQILRLIDDVDGTAAATVTQAMTTAYQTGAWATALTGLVDPTFTAISSAAVAGLAKTTTDDLLAATQGVRESVKNLVRALSRDELLRVMYTGVTPTDVARHLRKALEGHGLHAVTYADGRKVGLATYADMVLRTKSAEAYQTGGLDQGEALGWEWWEIMDGPGCGWTTHEDPLKANGRIVRLDEAREHPLSHPNCRRSSSPRPDLMSADDAANASPFNPEAVAEIHAEAVRRAKTPTAMPVPGKVATPATVATPVVKAKRRTSRVSTVKPVTRVKGPSVP